MCREMTNLRRRNLVCHIVPPPRSPPAKFLLRCMQQAVFHSEIPVTTLHTAAATSAMCPPVWRAMPRPDPLPRAHVQLQTDDGSRVVKWF